MNQPSIQFDLPTDIFRVGEALRDAGGRPFLVGGWVRDALLGHSHIKDFDLEVFGLPMERLSKALRPLGAVHAVGRHFGVLKLNTRDAAYDISVPRRESNIGKGHKAFLVETDPDMTFEEAAARRDFTINAMGYDFFGQELRDPWGGREDLERGILRHVGPAFVEDPLRVLRAMQLAGRFELDIAPETLSLCRSLDLAELPRERLWEEFKKLLLQARRPSKGLVFAEPLGILPYFPELAALVAAPARDRTLAPWEGTLAMLDQAAVSRSENERENLVLMIAALCHRMDDAASEEPSVPRQATRSFLERLTNERHVIEGVIDLLAELPTPQSFHDRKDEVTQGDIRRLALRIRLPFLVRAAASFHRAYDPGHAFEAGTWLEREAHGLEVWDAPPEPILKGRHLLEQGMPPGPQMGEWVRRAFEHQLDGGFSTLEEALAWIRAHLNDSAREDTAGRRAP